MQANGTSLRRRGPQRDARHSACFEHAPEPLVLHAEGRILDANRAAVAIAGASGLEDLLNRSILDFVDPADHARVIARMCEMERSGTRAPAIDLRLRCVHGGAMEAEIISVPIDLPEGRVIQTAIRDVTERNAHGRARRESEARAARLAMVVRHTTNGVAITGLDGRVEWINEAFTTMTGYEREEVYGREPRELFGGQEPTDVAAAMRGAADGTGFVREMTLRCKHGDACHVRLEVQPLEDEDGAMTGYMSILTDLTQRVRTEQALRESEARYRGLVDVLPMAMYTCDAEGLITYYNEQAAELWGRRPALGDPGERLCGAHRLRRLDGTPLPVDEAPMAEALAKGRPARGTEVVIERSGGSCVTASANVDPLFDADGQISGAIGVFTDITERRRAEEALRASERRFRLLAENAQDVIFLYRLHPEPAFEFISPSVTVATGFPPEAYYADPDLGLKIVHPEDRPLVENLMRGEDRRASVTLRWMHRNGAVVHTEQRITPVRDENGRVVALEGIARDVTAHLEAEAAARAADRRYRKLVEQAIAGVYLIEDGRFTYVNPRFAEIFGFAQEEILAFTHVAQIAVEEDRALVADNVRRRHEGEIEEARYSFRGRRKDGGVVDVEVHGRTFEHGGGRAIVGMLLDVTQRKRQEQALVAAKERAEAMTRLKDAFLANMSHEIRTPLTAIIGATDVLRGEVSSETHELVGFIRRGGERLMETLNSVLDLAQLESGSVRLHCERVDLAHEAQKTLSIHRMRAEQQGLGLTLEIAGDEPARALADRAALGRVLSNLISNAVKFTREGGVTVRVRSTGDAAVLEVQDTGIGIGEAFLPHVFEEFRQESTGHARDYEGNGLGLALTRRLVEMMQGEISVASRQGEGTTFTVRLPACPPPQTTPREDGADVPAAEDGLPEAMRLLLVDDDPVIRAVVVRMLGRSHEVNTAESAEQALAMARSSPHDAVLLDINLGGEDTGEDVLRALRSMPGYAHVPVVALTAYAMPGDEARFLSAGFDAYASKPFRTQDLVRVLKPLFARR